jgi:GT2 family glycosyltransferase
MPSLSVIVVNWNGRHLLQDCLASLLQQSVPGIEILFVDNGSSDGSADFVRDRFPGVKILQLQQNSGFAAGNNRGIEASSSEYVALLNNDAVADPRWAESLLAEAERTGAGIVASKIVLEADRSRLDSAGDGMTTAGVAYKRGHLEPASFYASAETVFGASGCAMLLRRSMLDDIGLLDEDFFLIYEDSDLCFRAQLRGWQCCYAPEAVVYHKLNASIGKLSRVHVFYGQRNVEYLYLKNMPGRLAWRYLPAHLLNTMLAWAYFTGKGHGISFIRSKIDFLRNIRRVMRRRIGIQRRRTVSGRELNRMLNPRWLRARLPGK